VAELGEEPVTANAAEWLAFGEDKSGKRSDIESVMNRMALVA